MNARIAQTSLGIVGVAAMVHGVWLFLESKTGDTHHLMRIAGWFVAGLILHDFLFAPLCLLVALIGRKLLPKPMWAPMAAASFSTIALTFLAIPVWEPQDTKPGVPPNPTLLDRDYHSGFALALGVIWTAAIVLAIKRTLSAHRSQRQITS